LGAATPVAGWWSERIDGRRAKNAEIVEYRSSTDTNASDKRIDIQTYRHTRRRVVQYIKFKSSSSIKHDQRVYASMTALTAWRMALSTLMSFFVILDPFTAPPEMVMVFPPMVVSVVPSGMSAIL